MVVPPRPPPIRGPTISTDHAAAVQSFVDEFLPEDEHLEAARHRGTEIGIRPVPAATGAALRWLAELIGARAVAEVGTGAGVSGLWLLRGMAGDGVLTSVDAEAESTRAARLSFGAAQVPSQRVRLITGRPLEVLSRLADEAYDLVFLGAETPDVDTAYSEALRLLRGGGIVVLAGVLAEGRVADPAQRDSATITWRSLLSAVRDDDRVRPLLLPVGGGLLVAQKVSSSSD